MTQSSVVVGFETKQSSFIISANESDLDTNVVASVQTARNAVKSTRGSQVVVQVTKGQCEMFKWMLVCSKGLCCVSQCKLTLQCSALYHMCTPQVVLFGWDPGIAQHCLILYVTEKWRSRRQVVCSG